MTRQIKQIEDLEIWDDFMFGVVMQKKELCRPLLEMILQVRIRKTSRRGHATTVA